LYDASRSIPPQAYATSVIRLAAVAERRMTASA
jgi:hypothetical protein